MINFFLDVIGHISDIIFLLVMMIGLYMVATSSHYIKKLFGLSMFQSSIFIFYISMGKVIGGTAPIIDEKFTLYSNPVPHVLMLTAIVVSIATTAVAYGFCVRVYEFSHSLKEEDNIDYLKNDFMSDNEHLNETL